MKKFAVYILGFISIIAIMLASGIPNTPNWKSLSGPFFWIWLITLGIAELLYNINALRRVTYPVTICIWAWLYDHKLLTTEFSRHTYVVFTRYGSSYRKLFRAVQDAFDRYIQAVEHL